jgi:hypothetical protein
MGKEFYIEEGFKQSATDKFQQDEGMAEKASQKFLDDVYCYDKCNANKFAQTKSDFCFGPFTEEEAIILKKKQAAEEELGAANKKEWPDKEAALNKEKQLWTGKQANLKELEPLGTDGEIILAKEKQLNNKNASSMSEKELKDFCAEIETGDKDGSWKSEKQLKDLGVEKQTGVIEKQPLDYALTLRNGTFGGPKERHAVADNFRVVAEMGGRAGEGELLDKINRRLVSEGSQYKLRFGQNVIKTPGGRRLEMIDRQGHVRDTLDFIVPVNTPVFKDTDGDKRNIKGK